MRGWHAAWVVAVAAMAGNSVRPVGAQVVAAAERAEAITTLATSLRAEYVFPERGAETADTIEARFRAGAYDGLQDGAAFADRLTADLRAITHDLHLGVTHSAEVLGHAGPRDPAVEAEWLARARGDHFGFAAARILPGGVGLLELRYFARVTPEVRDTALAAMRALAGVDALLVDLRANTGGDPGMVALLSSQLFTGDRPVHLNDLYYRPSDQRIESWTDPRLDVPRITGPVFTVTSGQTFSAAEEYTSNLKHLGRAIQVGETTGGGAHPGGAVRLSDHFQAFMPSGRAINPVTGGNWEGVGNVPEIAVPASAALDRAYVESLERLAAVATDASRQRALRALATRARTDGIPAVTQ